MILDIGFFRKAVLLSKLCLIGECFIFICYNFIYFISTYLNWSPSNQLSPDYFYQFNAIYLCLILANLIHLSYSGWLKNRPKFHNIYMYASLIIYVVTHSLLCHLLGELSINTGIMMTTAPLIGLILFNLKGVILGAVIGLVMVITSFTATQLGYINYAPLVSDAYPINTNIAFIIFTLCAISPHVSISLLVGYHSIENWKTREALSVKHAEIDILTNVPNRRKFIELIRTAIKNCEVQKTSLGLIMLDIDHFKRINDQFGHPVGDWVLIKVIERVSGSLRKSDMVARYGGDEFVVVMPDTNLSTAAEIAQRCLEAIQQIEFEIKGKSLEITASFGVASHQISGNQHPLERAHDIIKLADDALLVAKRLGRNRIQTTNQDPATNDATHQSINTSA